jgi:hypothetical protein
MKTKIKLYKIKRWCILHDTYCALGFMLGVCIATMLSAPLIVDYISEVVR